MNSSVVRIQKTAAALAGRRISVRVRDCSALGVLLLVGKNATWSVITGHFINPAPLPSVFWWYGLCTLHLALAARPLARSSWLGQWLAAVAGWGGCAASLVLAWLFLAEVSGTPGQPVAEWYDFVQLALAFVCAAATERVGPISSRENAG